MNRVLTSQKMKGFVPDKIDMHRSISRMTYK